MKAIERHRQSWQGKSDEWLFERLDNELKQKIEEIHRLLAENETLRQFDVSDCFYLQSEKTPADSGEYEVITNRGRVIKIKYKIFGDNGIWECEYGKHEINESVVAWRFLK